MEAGFDEAISKPYKTADIVAAIKRLCGLDYEPGKLQAACAAAHSPARPVAYLPLNQALSFGLELLQDLEAMALDDQGRIYAITTATGGIPEAVGDTARVGAGTVLSVEDARAVHGAIAPAIRANPRNNSSSETPTGE